MRIQVRSLEQNEWMLWRDLRRRALSDSPDAFRATSVEEDQRSDQWWEKLIRDTVGHPRGGLWIAEVESDPVGMLFGRLDPDSYALIIAAMWVDPAARGRGLGRKLLMTAVAWAKDSGSTAAELWVSDGNESALALYRGCGFTDTDERMPLREGSTIYVSKLRAELSQSPTQRE